MITLLLLVRATYMYGVVLRAHPVRGESHIQRNTTGEVATEPRPFLIFPKSVRHRKQKTAKLFFLQYFLFDFVTLSHGGWKGSHFVYQRHNLQIMQTSRI